MKSHRLPILTATRHAIRSHAMTARQKYTLTRATATRWHSLYRFQPEKTTPIAVPTGLLEIPTLPVDLEPLLETAVELPLLGGGILETIRELELGLIREPVIRVEEQILGVEVVTLIIRDQPQQRIAVVYSPEYYCGSPVSLEQFLHRIRSAFLQEPLPAN